MERGKGKGEERKEDVSLIFQDASLRMKKSVELFSSELSRVRTGRASLALLDGIKVRAYGEETDLRKVATLRIPEPDLIVVQPWDLLLLPEIEKAIIGSGRDLNPINDGKLIRIKIPPLVEEKKREIIKMIRKRAEEFKVAIRNIRRDTNEKVKGLKGKGQISEDEMRRKLDEVQKMTDEYISKIEEVLKKKEDEILGE